MNLSTLATAKFAQIKSFARANNLLPIGDLRLKATWLEAVKTFLTPVQEKAIAVIKTATTPAAVATYKAAAIVAYRFTYRGFIVSCLLTIALGMSTRDTWLTFQDWLESEGLTLGQPVAAVRIVAGQTRHRAVRSALQLYDRADAWVQDQTVRAWYAVDENATQPAQAFRHRLATARSALLA